MPLLKLRFLLVGGLERDLAPDDAENIKNAYARISSTARYVAYLRSFTDIPYAKEIAEECDAGDAFRRLSREEAESTVRLAPYWEARYKTTNRILSERGMTRILEIAAGLSPRGLEMTKDPDVVFVATDLEGILETERAISEKLLSRESAHRPNLHYIVANALDMDSLSSAATPLYDTKPLAVIAEGLIPYLNQKEKKSLAENVHKLLQDRGGIWIASDVHTRRFMQEVGKQEGTRKRMERISRAVNRDIANNVFADDDELKRFFKDTGFTTRGYPYSKVINELGSIAKLGLNPDQAKEIRDIVGRAKSLVLTRADE